MNAVCMRLGAGMALALLLGACAGQKLRPVAADAESLRRQTEREQALRAHPAWQLQGRIGVSDGRDGGSGTLDWRQQGDAFRFSVHAPVTGKTWVLSGDTTQARLEGLREQALESANATTLLERELGWQVPVTELVDWVRGMRAPGSARVEFRPDGLPARIEQAGWTVEFPAYDTAFSTPLPSRVFASKGAYKVRLAIREWTLLP